MAMATFCRRSLLHARGAARQDIVTDQANLGARLVRKEASKG
jgi:hypothetical protein